MADKKIWFTSEVNSLLKDLERKCNTLYLSRILLVYSEVKKLMDLCEDCKNCKSTGTKILIEKEMANIVDELHHYKVYDDRFKEVFDEGR